MCKMCELWAWRLQYVYQVYKGSKLSTEILEGVEDDEEHVQHANEFNKPEVIQVSDVTRSSPSM